MDDKCYLKNIFQNNIINVGKNIAVKVASQVIKLVRNIPRKGKDKMMNIQVLYVGTAE